MTYCLNIRSFVSVDVSIKDRISALQNRILLEEKWELHQVKPVEKQNFHFSIIFLGEVTPTTVERLKQKLSDIKFEPFRVTYTGLGVFPNTNNPRIIWMGTDPEGREELISLSKKITESIRKIGIVPDKPFIPHVTLLRLKDTRLRLQNMLKKYSNMSFGSDLVNKINLKKSELTRGGPVYSDILTVNGK